MQDKFQDISQLRPQLLVDKVFVGAFEFVGEVGLKVVKIPLEYQFGVIVGVELLLVGIGYVDQCVFNSRRVEKVGN